MLDHDGLAKRLLTLYLPDFLASFMSEVLPYTDFTNLTFLDKELPRANPRTKKRSADFVARVKFRGQDAFFLFHIEPQSSQQEHFGKRMHRYYAKLLDKYDAPIYPIALFTFTSPLDAQPTAYAINFPDFAVLRFNFRVIQLNRLNWRDFLERPNPVAAALMARMRIAKKDRPRVKAECLAMLLGLELSEEGADLVWEIVETYLPLNEKEDKTFAAELATIAPEAKTEMVEEFLTRRERGRIEGIAVGRIEGRVEGVRGLTLKLLEKRLGQMPEALTMRLQALGPEVLEQLSLASYDFGSLADLTAWLEAPGHGPTTAH